MITEILGKISITPKGQWIAGTYERLDLVTNAGSSYLSLKDENSSILTVIADWMLVADKGDAFEYADFTPEQLAGFKGDKLTFADLTPSDIAELQQPANNAIASIQAVELSVEQAEALRIQAEIDRQTNTGTAIQNAETATHNANAAKDLALEVANHPDIIQNDYWWKWNTTSNAYENTNIKAKGEQGLTGAQGSGVKITPWSAGAYLLNDQVNYLGKDWYANAATISTDVPGTSTKWVERLSGYGNAISLVVDEKDKDIAAVLGVQKKSDVNITQDTNLTKAGLVVPSSVGFHMSNFILIKQDYFLNINIGVYANICFYDADKNFLLGKSKADLDAQGGIMSGNYINAKISQIITNPLAVLFRFSFTATNDTIVNVIKNTVTTVAENATSNLNFLSDKAISAKAVENIKVQEDLLIKNVARLEILTDKIQERNEALIIENATFTRDSATTANPLSEIVITDTSGAVVTGDFTPYGTTRVFPAVVEYSDGSYDSVLIKSYTSTTATAESDFTKTVVKLGNMYDASLGQHLSNIGYKAMAYKIFNFPKRQAFKQSLIQGCDFLNHTQEVLPNGDLTLTNTLTGEIDLKFKGIGGANSYFMAITPKSLTYGLINSKPLQNYQDAVVGKGFETIHTFDYIGFVELYIGTDTLSFVGGCKVRFVNKDDNSVIQEITVKGSTQKVVFEHGKGNFAVQVVIAEAVLTKILVSAIYFWKKRVTASSLLWDKNDRIVFFTDSWGTFPETYDMEKRGTMFDGFRQTGECIFPYKFRDLFVQIGGKAENILLATKGSMTTAWAKFWLEKVIKETNPTKIIFHFSINDKGSKTLAANPSSLYDFDPLDMWNVKSVDLGGSKGAVSEAEFPLNLKYLKDTCIRKGITPIFIGAPKTAETGQSQELMLYNLKYFMNGI